MKKSDKISRGFTLIELVLVIVVIGIMATVALRSMLPTLEQSRQRATMKEMQLLVTAIVGDPDLVTDGVRADYGYVGDVGALPPDLDALLSNPGGYTTWNGPYIQNDFVEDINDFKNDAWGNNYTYSGGVTISSSGNGSAITEELAGSVSELTSNTVTGSVFDGLGTGPGLDASDISVTIFYPNGTGSTTSQSTVPGSDGSFTFSNTIPIGNHLIKAVFSVTSDTTARYVSVPPASSVYCELRFSGAIW